MTTQNSKITETTMSLRAVAKQSHATPRQLREYTFSRPSKILLNFCLALRTVVLQGILKRHTLSVPEYAYHHLVIASVAKQSYLTPLSSSRKRGSSTGFPVKLGMTRR